MMKKSFSRSVSALLALVLLVSPLFALAGDEEVASAEGLDLICLNWLEQIEKKAGQSEGLTLEVDLGIDSKGFSMLDALHLAAETLIRMGYETEETLADYVINTNRPNYVYGNAWLVNLRPQKGATEPVTYSVEINIETGTLFSVALGDLYAYGGKEATDRTPTVRETIVDMPVYGKDARELAKALALKTDARMGGAMPKPLEGTAYAEPGDADISQTDALEKMIEATVSQGGYVLGDLYQYRAGFALTEEDAGLRVWTILLVPPEILVAPYIRGRVDAGSGEMLGLEIVETMDRETRGITDEAAYQALVHYWMAHQASDFVLFEPDGFNGRPTADEVQLEESLRTAIDTVLTVSDLSLDALYTYMANANFYDKGCGVEGFGQDQRGWIFHFSSWTEDNIPGLINVTIDAQTGECTDILFAHSQFVNPSVSAQAALLARDDLTAVVDGWKARAGGALAVEQTAIPAFGVHYFVSSEEYGNPGTRDCPPEAALCAALDAVARMTGKEARDFADADVTLRYNGSRDERRHYIIDMDVGGQRYIVEVESPAVWLMRILLSQ